jgi:hypothetical protein
VGRKNVVHQYNMLDGQTVNMSSSITSNITNVEQFDKCSIHLTWTAGPAGTFKLQARNGGNPATPGLPKAKIDDSWYDLDFGSTMSITGTDSEILIQLMELPFTDIRLVYTASSGSASDLKALLSQKVTGA